jgi:histidine triad (HIT) family protein
MSNSDCIFCKIANGELPCHKIYENDSVLAFLDIGPVSEGHTLVIPKEHFALLDEMPGEKIAELCGCLGGLASAVVEAMDADGYNILCNNGEVSGQKVHHTHFHIIPRKEGDKILKGWPAYDYPDGKAGSIAERIKEKL